MNGKDTVNIDAIRVLPLFGTAVMFEELTEALDFILFFASFHVKISLLSNFLIDSKGMLYFPPFFSTNF